MQRSEKKRENFQDEGSLQTCTRSSKLDLQLIIDSSSSIGKEDFQLMLTEIADDLISHFDIGKDKTRVALFKFSSFHKKRKTVMTREIPLNGYVDAESLNAAIKAIKYEPGHTFTAEAMKRALAHYETNMRDDDETAKVCIVFTDGEASDVKNVPKEAKAWAGIGATVFAVGITKKITKKGLEDIAGSRDRIMSLTNFEDLGTKAKSLLAKVCTAVLPQPCKSNPCKHGSCQERSNDYVCKCEAGYIGKNCDEDIDDCAKDPCKHGTCQDELNDFTCKCDPGWEGKQCDKDIDDCAEDLCKHGICHDELNDFTCKCDPGWEGKQCDKDIDDCAKDPCKHGTCQDE